MKMPLGKHRGKDLSQVPRGYLRWLLRVATDLPPPLREALEWRAEGLPGDPPAYEAPQEAVERICRPVTRWPKD